MKILKKQNKLCSSCMEEHEVKLVETIDHNIFKNVEVSFEAQYEYCDRSEEYFEDEVLLKKNDLAMKDAYRAEMNLYTSKDIINLREKYQVSQKDLSIILGWGAKTITRYENHQVQDRTHDDLLKKIDDDPEWFLNLLDRSKSKLTEKAYQKYSSKGSIIFKNKMKMYEIKSIEALYQGLDSSYLNGGTELDLEKVISLVNYFAQKIESLHKVKLMKLLWYADSLSFKRYGKSITGLVYRSLPMGAVPEGYNKIINLQGINYSEVDYGYEDKIAVKFHVSSKADYSILTNEDTLVIESIINQIGHLNTNDIVERMHDEKAYKKVKRKDFIPFIYASDLSID